MPKLLTVIEGGVPSMFLVRDAVTPQCRKPSEPRIKISKAPRLAGGDQTDNSVNLTGEPVVLKLKLVTY